jgi:hypothetical protein
MKSARVIRIGLAHSLRLFKIQRSKITEQFFPVRNRNLYFNFQHIFSPADSFTAYKTRRNCSGSEQLQQKLKSPPALRAEFKILGSLIPAVSAPPPRACAATPGGLYRAQVPRLDIDILTPRDPLSDCRVKLVQRTAAACLHIIMLIPPQKRNKEKSQGCIGHKNLIPPIPTTHLTYNLLAEIEIFPTVRDSHNKKHNLFPPNFPVFTVQVQKPTFTELNGQIAQ